MDLGGLREGERKGLGLEKYWVRVEKYLSQDPTPKRLSRASNSDMFMNMTGHGRRDLEGGVEAGSWSAPPFKKTVVPWLGIKSNVGKPLSLLRLASQSLDRLWLALKHCTYDLAWNWTL